MREETVQTGVRMPKSIRDKIQEIADKRNVDLSVIVKEACEEYIRYYEDPSLLRHQIRQILKDDPTLLDEPIRQYGLQQLARK